MHERKCACDMFHAARTATVLLIRMFVVFTGKPHVGEISRLDLDLSKYPTTLIYDN